MMALQRHQQWLAAGHASHTCIHAWLCTPVNLVHKTVIEVAYTTSLTVASLASSLPATKAYLASKWIILSMHIAQQVGKLAA